MGKVTASCDIIATGPHLRKYCSLRRTLWHVQDEHHENSNHKKTNRMHQNSDVTDRGPESSALDLSHSQPLHELYAI
jgi:hypothetical protein